MGKFAVALKRTLDTTKTVGTVVADATRPRRGYLYYWSVGSETAPGDNNIELLIRRCTSAGTPSVTVPVISMLDQGDVLTEADAGQAHTAEPAYGTNDLFREIWNQKYGAKWYAPPSGEIVYPATGSNGFGVLTPVCTSGTPLITFECHVDEK